ncbi:MAG: hypothetical protein NVV63_12695 [Opitutus sp.]|nr:hypothetical protein [Opitutus sp.]
MISTRTLPHSLEAEEFLLSCCLLDGADIISRCITAGITPASFYHPPHQTVFDHLVTLFSASKPIDVAILAEELKNSKQLEAVGGYPFLLQVSGRIPTTGQAGYFMERVVETHKLREVIKLSTGLAEACYDYSGGGVGEEVIAPLLTASCLFRLIRRHPRHGKNPSIRRSPTQTGLLRTHYPPMPR